MAAGKLTDNKIFRRFEPFDCCDEYDMLWFSVANCDEYDDDTY